MTYKELFKDYYADNPLLQVSKSFYLSASLKNWTESSVSIKLLYKAISKQYDGAQLHPDELIKILREMGFPEWVDLEKFIHTIDESGFNVDQFLNTLDPDFPEISECGIAKTGADLYQIFLNVNFPLPASNYPGSKLPFIFVDTQMKMPADEDIQKIVNVCPSDIEKYSAEGRDCDDYSRIFLGWLSRKGKGNLTFGWVNAFLHYENGAAIYHSFCWAVSKEGNVWLIEPQNDKRIWKHGEAITIPNVISIEPTFMGI